MKTEGADWARQEMQESREHRGSKSRSEQVQVRGRAHRAGPLAGVI